MAPDINDKFTFVALATRTGLTVQHNISDSSIQCSDLSAWAAVGALTAVYFAMDRIDPTSDPTNPKRLAGTYTEWKGVVAGNTIGSMQLKSGADQTYPADAYTRVYMVITQAWANSIINGLLVSLKQNGKLKDNAIDNASMFAAGVLVSALSGANLSIGALTTSGNATLGGKSSGAVQNIASSATLTPDMGSFNSGECTALATNATIAAPTGSAANGQWYLLRITASGGTRTLSWNATYTVIGSGVILPTSLPSGKTALVSFRYSSASSRMEVVGASVEA